MDRVDDLLATMRIEAPGTSRCKRAPWGLACPPRQSARLVLVAEGSCRLYSDVLDQPQPLRANDCFLVHAGVGFTLRDADGSDVVDCDDLAAQAFGHRVRVGGNGEATRIVSTRFIFDAVAAEMLFALLPPLFRLRPDAVSGQLLRATFDLIDQESAADRRWWRFATVTDGSRDRPAPRQVHIDWTVLEMSNGRRHRDARGRAPMVRTVVDCSHDDGVQDGSPVHVSPFRRNL